jgi:hypothetical protein
MKRLSLQEVFKSPPRLMVAINIYDDGFECGANCHYSMETSLVEALADFFWYVKTEHAEYHIDLERSKLKIKYLDLPKTIEKELELN